MRTFIYTRVSTGEQALYGYSLDAQAKACMDYCTRENLFIGSETNCEVPGLIIDSGRSAFRKTMKQRPGGMMLLKTLKTGDTVVATTVHRMFRNVQDMVNTMEFWVSTGVNVRFCDYPMLNTHTANGKALLQIFAVMAQLKSELASARVKEAFRIRRNGEGPQPVTTKPVALCPPPIVANTGEVLQTIAATRLGSRYKFTGTVRAYVRVSTAEQTVAQQKDCILRNLPEGVQPEDVVWYEDEGYSAFKMSLNQRPAGRRMLDDMQTGDLILVWRPDRMFRSILDMAKSLDTIDKAGVSVSIVESGIRTDTAFGRTMISMLSVLAELESAEISRSTKYGLMVALATSHGAQMQRVPKYLRSRKQQANQVYYAFDDVFTQAQRMEMYLQYFLTRHKYGSNRIACRVISNIYLKLVGLPPLVSEDNDLRKAYTARLRSYERRQSTPVVRKVIQSLKKQGGKCVSYPMNVTSLSTVTTNMGIWMTTSKMVKDRKACSFVATCADKEAAVNLLEAVGSVD